MEPEVSANFQDIEPGWSCIYFTHPPRLANSRLHSLLQFLEKWRQANPMRRIVHFQVIRDKKIVRGLNVFWSTFEHLRDKSKIAHFTIHEEVRDLYGHEYCEALMQDALHFAEDNPLPESNVVLISRRKIAIVIFRTSGQSLVCTLDRLLPVLPVQFSEGLRAEFARWIQTEERGYFCSTLPSGFELEL
jgi:hypothetical protein